MEVLTIGRIKTTPGKHNGVLPDGVPYGGAVGLAEIRRHGFVSLRADDYEDIFYTHRILFKGEELRINGTTGPDLYSFRVAGPAEGFTRPLTRVTHCGYASAPPLIDGVLADDCWQDFTHSGVAADFTLCTEVTPAPPTPGEHWQTNILRHRYLEGNTDRSCWSCMFGGLHRNDRSGVLVFD